jgi:uridine kinase
MEAVDKLLKQINMAVRQNKRFILGIDGLSRSGKTTLTNMLGSMLSEKNINSTVIHLDDHIVEKSKRYNTGCEEWHEYYYLQWDIEWLRKSMFENLIHSEEIEMPYYDNETDQHNVKTLNLAAKEVIIVEGIFLQREEWKLYLDYTVFIDCPRDVRFGRENSQTQQNIEKFKNRYWKAEDFYMDKLQPVEKADLVISYYESLKKTAGDVQ